MTDISYTKRYSKKAKYLQLRLSHAGLEVIIPNRLRVSTTDIEEFIQQKQHWIKKHKNKLTTIPVSSETIELPTSIDLKAIDQLWSVTYLPTDQPKIKLISNLNQGISLLGNTHDQNKCLQKLRTWLHTIAQEHLGNYLGLFSQETNLPFKQVSIRNNTTRWGSCSSKLDISLCCKLLFLPYPLMRHVLLHELCHTKVMHHGKKFWKLLSNFDEHMEKHVKELKEAAIYIPRWVY